MNVPELNNPYESPQCDATPLPHAPPSKSTQPYPRLMNLGLAAQLLLVLALIVVALLAGRSLSVVAVHTLMFVIISSMGLLSAVLFALALRLRYGWLIVVELVLLSYSLLGFSAITSSG